jgi:hypothetical protein
LPIIAIKISLNNLSVTFIVIESFPVRPLLSEWPIQSSTSKVFLP